MIVESSGVKWMSPRIDWAIPAGIKHPSCNAADFALRGCSGSQCAGAIPHV
jgi:hypothetical protein